jgi:hypothetical protein
MPPYNPPSAHYCEINAYTNPTDNFKLVGPQGHNFKRLTEKLGIEYLWWNMERNVIEIWGDYSKMNSSHKYLSKYMKRFYSRHCENTQFEMSIDVQPSKKLKVSSE